MSTQTTGHGWVRPIAGLGAVLYAIACVVSLLPSMMSPMMFDAPGSEKRVILWILVGLLLFLPIDFFGAVIALGLSAWKRWRIVMFVAFAMPALHVALIGALFALL